MGTPHTACLCCSSVGLSQVPIDGYCRMSDCVSKDGVKNNGINLAGMLWLEVASSQGPL